MTRAAHAALAARELAHPAAKLGILGHALGEDVARALQRSATVGTSRSALTYCAAPRPAAAASSAGRSRSRRRAARARARARSSRACGASACTAGTGPRAPAWSSAASSARAQLGVELALLVDGLQDRGAALLQLAQVLRALADVAQLHLVEAAGGFLAVAGDERQRVAFVEQRERAGDLARRERELLRHGRGDL